MCGFGFGVAVLAAFVLAPAPMYPPALPPLDETVVPVLVAAPVAPPPAPATSTPHIDEPIEYLAAASDAPVIAVASGHHVWISRDDGATFAPALQDPGAEIYDLSVDPAGRVYALWGENKRWRSPGGGGVDTIEFALGTADLDGRERWRPVAETIAAPLDARGGWVVGSGAPVIGRDFGASWTPVPSGSWHVWRASIDDHHTARFLASRIDAPESCEDCGRGLTLLVAREGQPLTRAWSMLDRTEISTDDFPANVLACAGFAGSTLYLVARAPKGARLIAVTGDGKVLKKESLNKVAADATCTIAGNDHAAFMALGDDMIRIDTGELRVAPAGALTPRSANDRDVLALDEHGSLLYVADACVWRYTESGTGPRHKVVCGSHR